MRHETTIAAALVSLLVCFCTSAASDTDSTIEEAIKTCKQITGSPEFRGTADGDLLTERIDAALAEIPWEELDTDQLVRIVGDHVLQFSSAASANAADRLDALVGGDDIEAVAAALLRMQVLLDDDESQEQRAIDAARAALSHPMFGVALHRLHRPTGPLMAMMSARPPLREQLLPEMLGLSETLPLDPPVSVITEVLPDLFRVIRNLAERTDTDAVERARARFAAAAASTLSTLADDEVIVAEVHRMNPQKQRGSIDVAYIESMRRSRMESVREALGWLTGADARGTLIGHPIPTMEFIWARNAPGAVNPVPLRTTSDFRGKVTLVVSIPMEMITHPTLPDFERRLNILRAIAERLADKPVTLAALTWPRHHPLSTMGGKMTEPPDDIVRALHEAVEAESINFAVALVDGDIPPDLGVRQSFPPILLDSRTRVVKAGVNLARIDDLTEQINEVLVKSSVVEPAAGPQLPKVARNAILGEPAPNLDFEWTSEGLEARTLEDLRGKVVVLDFWATWCGPCVRAFPNLRDLRSKFSKDDLIILGVTSLQGRHVTPRRQAIDTRNDPEIEHELMIEFIEQMRMTWSVAFTKQRVYNRQYGVRAVPSSFVLDREGNLRSLRLNPAVGRDHRTIEKLVEELINE